MNETQKKRIREAEDMALDRLDYILKSTPAPDFVEIVGCIGGDTVTYRVYEDGSMYQQ